ncbi:MAG: hypothetical protein H6Q72_1278 [Firmicutes bacterium]|nr:hypothetical protein [Bacillota bacterium]
MLQIFRTVEKKRSELEELRVIIQATEITYRQRGELHIAESLKNLEANLEKAVDILST